MKGNSLIAEIDAILPQTQCRQCGFPGCEPYATAIAQGRADINQCPPGGEQGIRKLAELLGVKPMPLNTAHGVSKPKAVARIGEQACIGCTLCISVCPVDAIVGAARQMHTVIATECTGCELCIPACPVDCISMIPPSQQVSRIGVESTFSTVVTGGLLTNHDETRKAADRARTRYRFRLKRLEREKQEREERLAQKTGALKSVNNSLVSLADSNPKQAAIQAALEHARIGRTQTTKAK